MGGGSLQKENTQIYLDSEIHLLVGITNFKTNLSQSESDGLGFPLKIRYREKYGLGRGKGGGARREEGGGKDKIIESKGWGEGQNYLGGGAIKILETGGVKF